MLILCEYDACDAAPHQWSRTPPSTEMAESRQHRRGREPENLRLKTLSDTNYLSKLLNFKFLLNSSSSSLYRMVLHHSPVVGKTRLRRVEERKGTMRKTWLAITRHPSCRRLRKMWQALAGRWADAGGGRGPRGGSLTTTGDLG